MLSLSQLPVGQIAVIHELELPPQVEHHLMHMGFVPETRVQVLRRAPAGDPTVYAVDGMEIALRRETAGRILVRPVVDTLPDATGNYAKNSTAVPATRARRQA